jgi:hypothetical protein
MRRPLPRWKSLALRTHGGGTAEPFHGLPSSTISAIITGIDVAYSRTVFEKMGAQES